MERPFWLGTNLGMYPYSTGHKIQLTNGSTSETSCLFPEEGWCNPNRGYYVCESAYELLPRRSEQCIASRYQNGNPDMGCVYLTLPAEGHRGCLADMGSAVTSQFQPSTLKIRHHLSMTSSPSITYSLGPIRRTPSPRLQAHAPRNHSSHRNAIGCQP